MAEEISLSIDARPTRNSGLRIVPLSEARISPLFRLAERAYRIWWSINPGYVPYRQEVDPISFGPEALPHLSLIDVIGPEHDYLWRLAGEEVNRSAGLNLSGHKLSEIEAELSDWTLLRPVLDDVVSGNDPVFYVFEYQNITGCSKQSFGVLLPLRERTVRTGPHADHTCHILHASHTQREEHGSL